MDIKRDESAYNSQGDQRRVSGLSGLAWLLGETKGESPLECIGDHRVALKKTASANTESVADQFTLVPNFPPGRHTVSVITVAEHEGRDLRLWISTRGTRPVVITRHRRISISICLINLVSPIDAATLNLKSWN